MECEIVQEGNGKYLKITRDGGRSYADKIFSYQEIEGFLPMEIRRVNGRREALYDISGKVVLSEYLGEELFTLSGLQKLLNQIFSMQEQMEEYLLEGSGVLVSEEYLFYNRNTGKIEGIYEGGKDAGGVAAFGRLLEFVMQCMNQKDRELVFFVYGMHKLTKETGCTRGDLQRYVNCGGAEPEEAELEEDAEWKEKKAAVYSRAGQRAGLARQDAQKPEKAGAAKLERTSFLSVFIAVAGILIPLVLWKFHFFDAPLTGKTDWKKLLGAAAFFLTVCGYTAWKVGKYRRNVKTEDVDYEAEGVKQVCLIPEQRGEELIPVRYFPFYLEEDRAKSRGLGSSSLREGAAGSSVFQITQEAGTVYAADRESPQGNWHNGSRMAPWQKVELRDGDFLTIGEHEFVVEITADMSNGAGNAPCSMGSAPGLWQ